MLYVLLKKAIIIIISKTVFFPFWCYLCRSLEASSRTTMKPWFHGDLQVLTCWKSWDTQWYYLPSMPSIQIRSKNIDIHNCVGLMTVFICYDAWRAVTKCGPRALVLSKLNYCNSLLYGTTSQKNWSCISRPQRITVAPHLQDSRIRQCHTCEQSPPWRTLRKQEIVPSVL